MPHGAVAPREVGCSGRGRLVAAGHGPHTPIGKELAETLWAPNQRREGARADTREAAIGFQDRILCGKFVDIERPTFTELMHEHYEKTLGDRYVPMKPEGGWIHE